VDEHAVLAALAWYVADDRRRVRQMETRNEYYVSDLAHRASKAVTVDFPALLAAGPPTGATSRQRRERARQRKQWQRFFSTKVQMKYGEVGSGEIEEDLKLLGPETAKLFADMVRQEEHDSARGKSVPTANLNETVHDWWDKIPFERFETARTLVCRCAAVNAALHDLAYFYEEPRGFLADISTEAAFAELVILPGSLINPVALSRPFAELVLSLAPIDLALIQAALYAEIVGRFVAAPVRGFERLREHAKEHDLKLPQLPTYEQVEMVGNLDIQQSGEALDDIDVIALVNELGLEPTPWIRGLQAEWERMLSEEADAAPGSQVL
jgi:hypothetical protein